MALEQRLLADHVFTWLAMRGHMCFARMEKKIGLPWRGVLHRGCGRSGRQFPEETSGVLFFTLLLCISCLADVRFPVVFAIHGEEDGKRASRHPLLFMTFLDVYFHLLFWCQSWHSLESRGQGVEMLTEEADYAGFFYGGDDDGLCGFTCLTRKGLF
ncbi:hypothetical protein LY76DRAFT_163458 [Colletotrichum caudatum]|nr:hypothetical protein LY76DRAFT_163458 [Colletotrichum caudatum]